MSIGTPFSHCPICWDHYDICRCSEEDRKNYEQEVRIARMNKNKKIMKWYNKDKTEMIDLSEVKYFNYITLEKAQEQGSSGFTFDQITLKGNRLDLQLAGNMICKWGEDANEIYKMLISQKEVI